MITLGSAQVAELALAEVCERHRVRELALFGSAARDAMSSESDIDLLVEFQPNAPVDLVDHASLMLDLERLVGRKVDLVSKRGLKPRIRESILRQARPLYAA
jgi:hypothetical protein